MVIVFLWTCAPVPITGRKQVSFILDVELQAMSYAQNVDFLKKHTVIKGARDAEMFTKIGTKIQKAVEVYFMQQGMSGHLNDYAWELNLVKY